MHEVKTAFECGWATLENGALLAAAEAEGFEALVTTDQNLRYQQNLNRSQVAVVVISTTSWPRMKPHAERVEEALAGIGPGGFIEVVIP